MVLASVADGLSHPAALIILVVPVAGIAAFQSAEGACVGMPYLIALVVDIVAIYGITVFQHLEIARMAVAYAAPL